MPVFTNNAALPVVLDTNVVLDWLVFDDRAARPLAAALVAGRLRWHATAAMLDELAHVLARQRFERRHDRAAHALAAAAAAAQLWTGAPPTAGPRCADPDDQPFIDLALALPARWLLTHDRALLALRRAAAARGVTVCTPRAWADEIAIAPPGA